MEAKTDEYQEQQPVSFDTFKEKPRRKRARTEKQYASAVRNAEKARRGLAAKRAGGQIGTPQLTLEHGGGTGGVAAGDMVRAVALFVAAVMADPECPRIAKAITALVLRCADM